jgi:succinate dehydrogenase / fumarate reductase iron-sulfur subunit
MNLKLKIWRQRDPNTRGKFVNYKLKDVSPDSSFLEMLDVLNEELVAKDEEPIVFDDDCREGICGACGMYINGRPHGPDSLITVCQLHMRKFNDGDTIVIEPWRARAFPIIRDLMVDRSAFDTLIQESGYVSVNTGSAPDANNIPVPKKFADLSMDAAACIGCGACVAACKNASAMLFVGAKISHLTLLPQGNVEAEDRVLKMVAKMDELGFGNCTNTGAGDAVCPKGITLTNIARQNREYYKATV